MELRPIAVSALLVVLAGGCSRLNPGYEGGGTDSAGEEGGSASSESGREDDASGTATSGDDPCEPELSGCHPDATCTVVGDQPECSCDPDEGRFGDGFECVSLESFRAQMPCTSETGNYFCEMEPDMDSARLVGDPQVLYTVTLHVRGVIEQVRYEGGVDRDWYYLGGEPAQGSFNIFALEVPGSAELYHLNAGQPGFFACVPLDEKLDVELSGDSILRLFADPRDGQGLRNRDGRGEPIVVEGVEPAPEAFPGQFMQIDLVNVERP
ncbi:MAG: calcium-binding EGF-like domain-containing protein [Myxococcota bacterium]